MFEDNNDFSIFRSGQARGQSKSITLSHEEFEQATMYVLQNCEELWPYMEKYEELQAQDPTTEHKGFVDWFRAYMTQLCTQSHASEELKSLSIGPMRVVNRYSMFMVNGFRFHTKDRAMGKRTQNSGVMVIGDDNNAEKEYYGVLEHIYELSYIGNRKVYLFKCHWWDVGHISRGYKVDKYGFISVNTRYSLQTNEPFILASQAKQVFYVEDIIDPSWLVVIKTNPRDLFKMPFENDNGTSDNNVVIDEEAYQQLVVDLNLFPESLVQPELLIDLFRNDVPSQTFVQVGEPSQTSNHNTRDLGFIDDTSTYSLVNEDSEEEEVLEDNGTDTDSESEENQLQETDTSESGTKD